MTTRTITHRMRRLRRTENLRRLVRDTHLSTDNLICPLFVNANLSAPQAIDTLPGQYQYDLASLPQVAKEIVELTIPAVILFGIPQEKDAVGSDAWQPDGVICQAIQTIKQATPELVVIADTCFCEYTDHGHCGVQDNHGELDNDLTLDNLAKQAIAQAESGADIIAPSGMLDGMVDAIRTGLDEAGFTQVAIMSYSAKFASSFYGPFRAAAECSLKTGDRRGYQMDFASQHQVSKEVALDIEEGADFVMVKPAGAYLDIISQIHHEFPETPLSAYQVSGEYAMICAAAEQGLIDKGAVMEESLMAIRRAGAQSIITYFAREMAEHLIP